VVTPRTQRRKLGRAGAAHELALAERAHQQDTQATFGLGVLAAHQLPQGRSEVAFECGPRCDPVRASLTKHPPLFIAPVP